MSIITLYSTIVKSMVDIHQKISERAKVAAAAGANLRTQIMQQYKGGNYV